MAGVDEDRLIELIYDSAVDDVALADVIRDLQQLLHAHVGFAFHDTGQAPDLWRLSGIDPAPFATYAAYYHRFDLFRDNLLATDRLKPGVVATDRLLASDQELRRSPFVQELLRPQGLGPLIGSSVHCPSRGGHVQFSFYRPTGADDYGFAEIEALRRLAPHLGRAARLRLRGLPGQVGPGWAADALEGLAWGVLLLGAAGQVLFANGTASQLLAKADGLSLGRDGLRASTAGDRQALDRAVGLALRGGPNGEGRRGSDVRIGRPSGERPWLVTLQPLGPEVPVVGDRSPRAALHLFAPTAAAEGQEARLGALFGLSPAEARLALELLADHRLEAIADRRGVALSTVKTQLLAVFAKTDTDRQSSLVALLARCLAVAAGSAAEAGP